VADVALDTELHVLASKGLSKTRKKQLFRGLDMAISALHCFEAADPKYPKNVWHYRVAKATDLKRLVPSLQNSYLKLSKDESSSLVQMLGDMEDDETLSFSKFCVMLGEIIGSRQPPLNSMHSFYSAKDRAPSLAEMFLTQEEAEHLSNKIPDYSYS